MKTHKLYIDDEGVRRGYYVYLHKAKESGKVFYVGKGSGKRAWETNNRNSAWKERVAELEPEWEVEIYKDDLSEIEAFHIEEELVKKFGFFDDENDQLTNHIPGGEMPASFTINFGNDEIDEWQEVYYKKRKFLTFSKKEREDIASKIHENLDSIYWELNEIDNQTDYVFDDEEESNHNAFMLIGAFEEPMIGAEEFLKKRVSWKEFCLDLESSYEYFQSQHENDKINKEKFSPKVFDLFIKSRALVIEAYQKVDSGNKQEAIQLANQATTNIPIQISSQIPDQANVIQISSEKESDKLFEHICQVITSNGFKIEHKDSNELTLETEFVEFKNNTTLQINVSVEKTKTESKAILKGRIKDGSLSKLFAKHNKPEISFESKWCSTKFPRLSFGTLAFLANQEIAHTEINYLIINE